ncbi:MAG: hypothetical protein PUP93_02335 [Rhizonema sp. NSF051]|nr:hypothetical protein [Rhizonema sp. NSF051]
MTRIASMCRSMGIDLGDYLQRKTGLYVLCSLQFRVDCNPDEPLEITLNELL